MLQILLGKLFLRFSNVLSIWMGFPFFFMLFNYYSSFTPPQKNKKNKCVCIL